MEKQIQQAMPSKQRPGLSPRRAVTVAGAILAMLSVTCIQLRPRLPGYQSASSAVFDKVQECAIHNLHQDLSFLDQAKPIEAHEFIERRDRLAQALSDSNVDAFVLEPGYTFQYGYPVYYRNL